MKKIFTIVAAFAASASLMAAETPVAAGNGTLSAAISAAAAGDVLVLGGGDYTEAAAITIDKALTMKAADGAQPVIAMGGKFEVSAGVTVEGIKFDGPADAAVFEFVGGTGYETSFKGCTFTNCQYGINVSSEEVSIDKMVIEDCMFSYFTASAVETAKGSTAPGVIKDFLIKNSTLMHGGAGAPALHITDNDYSASTEGPTITVDHITVFNTSVTDYTLYMQKVGGTVKFTNCIVSNPDYSVSEHQAYYGYDGNTVDNCLWWNCSDGARTGTVATNLINADPMFKDADNDDLSLLPGSPAIGAGTDKSNLGDPRWDNKESALRNVAADKQIKKVMMDGQMVIIRNGAKFNVLGTNL